MKQLALLLIALLMATVVCAQFQKQSPGAAIDGAVREAAKNRSAQDEEHSQGVDILSPTDGVDLGYYLQTILTNVRKNWFRFIPASARGPERRSPWSRKPKLKQGIVVVEFAIERNGQITNLHVTESSGDEEFDKAALAGVSEAAPFPHLPDKLKSDPLRLRFHFYYNPSHCTSTR